MFMKYLFNKIAIFSYLFVFIALCVCFYLFSHQGWNNYYRKKLYLPPAQITQSVLSFFPQAGLAIDFGCGCGNDTAFLLNNGWTIWAIDGEATAIQILKKRKDV